MYIIVDSTTTWLSLSSFVRTLHADSRVYEARNVFFLPPFFCRVWPGVSRKLFLGSHLFPQIQYAMSLHHFELATERIVNLGPTTIVRIQNLGNSFTAQKRPQDVWTQEFRFLKNLSLQCLRRIHIFGYLCSLIMIPWSFHFRIQPQLKMPFLTQPTTIPVNSIQSLSPLFFQAIEIYYRLLLASRSYRMEASRGSLYWFSRVWRTLGWHRNWQWQTSIIHSDERHQMIT